LPLTTDEFSFAHNWLTSAQHLWEAGDRHAASYQVDQVAKKLMLGRKGSPIFRTPVASPEVGDCRWSIRLDVFYFICSRSRAISASRRAAFASR
jgi:hypothetical protein